jgi:hypothetical protein
VIDRGGIRQAAVFEPLRGKRFLQEATVRNAVDPHCQTFVRQGYCDVSLSRAHSGFREGPVDHVTLGFASAHLPEIKTRRQSNRSEHPDRLVEEPPETRECGGHITSKCGQTCHHLFGERPLLPIRRGRLEGRSWISLSWLRALIRGARYLPASSRTSRHLPTCRKVTGNSRAQRVVSRTGGAGVTRAWPTRSQAWTTRRCQSFEGNSIRDLPATSCRCRCDLSPFR